MIVITLKTGMDFLGNGGSVESISINADEMEVMGDILHLWSDGELVGLISWDDVLCAIYEEEM